MEPATRTVRVIGLDPGTVSISLCGLDDGRVFLDLSLPTRETLADPAALLRALSDAMPLDLVAGPSAYGLPVTRAQELTDRAIRLALLSAAGEPGGIGGLGSLLRALGRSTLPVVLTPGVVHLPSVPDHRKINRVDMGTADKVSAAALAVAEESARLGCATREVSFVLLELGGAFTAALAVERGRIVDGMGGTSGPLGARSAGAWDGEVAFLAGTVTKQMLFDGGALSVAGEAGAPAEALASPVTPRGRVAWEAWLEGAAKAVAAMRVASPLARDVLLSGRLAGVSGVRDGVEARLAAAGVPAAVRTLAGLGGTATHAAQGAALIADGLAGGRSVEVVEALGIREARGSVLDHLYVVSPDVARSRLGI